MANKTVTVKTSGGDYTSLSAALTAESANLVTNTCILTIECYAMSDTTPATTGTGYTTNASYYINIVVPTAERHDGKWNSAKYRMELSGSVDPGLYIRADYTRVTGIQIRSTTSAEYNTCVPIRVYASQGTLITNSIINCHTDYWHCYTDGIDISTEPAELRNVVVYRTGTGLVGGGRMQGIVSGSANVTLSNVTVCGFSTNYTSYSTGTVVATNCISQASLATGYAFATSTGSDYNLSDRADAPGTTVYNSKTLTFINSAAGDFHLAAGDTDAIDMGTSLSGTFTDDIDGVTRSGTWDLGADEYVAAGGGSTFVPQVIMVL